MSTSERSASSASAGDLASVIDLTGASAAKAAGMPDPSLLSRLANEFFGSLPRESFGVPGLTAAIPGDLAAPTQTGVNAVPTSASSYAPTIVPLIASADRAATGAGPVTGSTLPGVSSADAAGMALIPEFAFLRDVRSLESFAQTSTDQALRQTAGTSIATGVPQESQFRSLASGTPALQGVQAVPAMPATGHTGLLSTQAGNPIGSAVPAGGTALPGSGSFGSVPTSAGHGSVTPAAIPGVTDSALIPGFGFLHDTRSLDALTQNAISQSVATAASPTLPAESQLRSLAASTPAAPGAQAVPAALAYSPASFGQGTSPALAVPGVSALPGLGGSTDPVAAAGIANSPHASIPTMAAPVSPTASLPFGISFADLASPQLLGATQPSAHMMRDALGFLDLTRPIEPVASSSLGAAPAATVQAGAPTGAWASSPTTASLATGSTSSAPSTFGGLRAADISSVPFDVLAVRRDFPILQERINGRPLIWLDNAATTQKPQSVIDRIKYFYEHENSNVHRAAHTLAARSTDAYEAAREKVRQFLNAASAREIVFVRGATEGINLIAQSWGKQNIHKDDEILITHLEHHANIVPWQMLCAEKGAKLRVAPVDDTGQVILEEYERLFTPRTRLVSFPQVSNALGTVTPVRAMTQIARRHGATVVIDGAQGLSHMRVDMQEYDCDFYVFSGHKLFAPTGIGVVYGKLDLLEHMPPYQGGGNMIADVTFEKTVYNAPPVRFEAGTGNIADAVGLGAAIDYLNRLGMPNIARYEHDLLVYGTEVLQRIPGLRLIGTAKEKASVLSFVLDGYRTEDVGAALAREGIAVRSGHHCAQPILRRFGVEATVRPSLAFYNTCEEIDALAAAIWRLKGGRTPSVI